MKKKLISIFITVVMFASLFVIPASADKTLGASTTTSVNMRKSASTSSSIILTLPKSAEVIVLSTSNGWSKIVYDNQIGYSYSSYLTADSTVSGKFGTGTISGTDVRMRKGAGTSYSIIGTYNNGTKMTVTGASGNWYKVSYNGTSGYVCADYMTISASASTSSTEKTYTGKIIGTDVRMRSGAGTSYSTLGTYSTGVTMTVYSSTNGWYKVEYDGQTGYVYGSYMHINPTTAYKETKNGTISGTAVKMRMGPSTDFSTVTELNNGTSVKISGEYGNWYEVSVNGKYGYVYKDYLKISTTTTTEKTYTGKIIGTDVRMRSGAGTSYSILGTYSNGVTMTVYSSTNGWYKVKYDGKTGYVNGSYMHINPATAYSEAKNGTISGTAVRMRMGPSSDFSIVTELNNGTPVKISGEYANWYEVSVNGKYGYICKDYIKLSTALSSQDSVGTVTGSAVRVRKGPGTSYDIVGYCDSGAQVTITGKSGNWYAIKYNNINGYICADYVRTGASSDLASKIIATAKQYLGTPYVYGGASPNGFDCSGFVHYVYEQYGYHLERGATGQYNRNGVKVDKSNLKPADLVFFSDSVDPIGHVGIYIGGGQFIHASSGKGCVTINKLDDYYYCEHYTAAKRII